MFAFPLHQSLAHGAGTRFYLLIGNGAHVIFGSVPSNSNIGLEKYAATWNHFGNGCIFHVWFSMLIVHGIYNK